jgi:hypothetical protein
MQLNRVTSVNKDLQMQLNNAQNTIEHLQSQERALRVSLAQYQRADAYSHIPATSLKLLLPRLALRLERMDTRSSNHSIAPEMERERRRNQNESMQVQGNAGAGTDGPRHDPVNNGMPTLGLGLGLQRDLNSRSFVTANPHLASTLLPPLHDISVDELGSQQVQRLLDDLVGMGNGGGQSTDTTGVGDGDVVLEQHRRKEIAQKLYLQHELLSARLQQAENVCERAEADLTRLHDEQHKREQDAAEMLLQHERRAAEQLATVARRLGSHLHERHLIQREKDEEVRRNECLTQQLQELRTEHATKLTREQRWVIAIFFFFFFCGQ